MLEVHVPQGLEVRVLSWAPIRNTHMSLIESIKHAHLCARKDRDAKRSALLSTLLGEAQMIGKNNGNRESTDGEVTAVIKKMISNTNETINILNKTNAASGDTYTDLQDEVATLSIFLPAQLTTFGLTNVLTNLIALNNATSIKDMGRIMKLLKEKYDGQYDGTEASKIIKGLLSVAG